MVSDANILAKQPSHEPQIQIAKCECCDLTEEYTTAYIDNVRKLYAGKWICGLCSEDVKYEIIRKGKQRIGVEEALSVHMRFCGEFRRSATTDPTADFVSVLRRILRRSRLALDSTRASRSAPGSPVNGIAAVRDTVVSRSESCLPTRSDDA